MTMELVTVEVRLPRSIYDRASEIFAQQGISMEDALILFFQETVRLGRIPFSYTEEDIAEVKRWEQLMADDLSKEDEIE